MSCLSLIIDRHNSPQQRFDLVNMCSFKLCKLALNIDIPAKYIYILVLARECTKVYHIGVFRPWLQIVAELHRRQGVCHYPPNGRRKGGGGGGGGGLGGVPNVACRF